MLTGKQIEAAKPKDKSYRQLDSCSSTYQPQGKKVWLRHLRLDGKERILTMGQYPLVSL